MSSETHEAVRLNTPVRMTGALLSLFETAVFQGLPITCKKPGGLGGSRGTNAPIGGAVPLYGNQMPSPALQVLAEVKVIMFGLVTAATVARPVP
jgi:hypothetical protein